MTHVYEFASEFNDEFSEEEEFICGVEYEIEDIVSLSTPNKDALSVGNLHESPIWFGNYGYQSDGSLRNNGVEIITKPLNFQESLQAFKEIHNDLILVGNEAYSPRTSIHVHVNVLPWTEAQLKHFILLYALMEPVFFNLTPGREHNIHCVPLNYTLLPSLYNRGAFALVHSWSKYTAFNLLPVPTQGTVEFRHMHGTGSYAEFERWLTHIKQLWDIANEKPVDWLEKQLRAGRWAGSICMEIFKYVPPVNFKTSTVDVKLAFV